jgi:hypothetical protein
VIFLVLEYNLPKIRNGIPSFGQVTIGKVPKEAAPPRQSQGEKLNRKEGEASIKT